jgi:hypothetical protein
MVRKSALSAVLFALLLASAGVVSYSARAGDDAGELALKPADVALYLQTMRAAANRVRHPTREDTGSLAAREGGPRFHQRGEGRS